MGVVINSGLTDTISRFINARLDDLWGLVFPTTCVSCHKDLLDGEDQICHSCLMLLPFTNFERMPANPSQERMSSFIEVKNVASILYYSNMKSSKRVLNALKYKGNSKLGISMGAIVGQRIADTEYAEVDVLVPVPLTPEKELKRGYNQSQMICEGISRQLGIPVVPALKRVRSLKSQTKLSRYDRWLNTRNDFELRAEKDVLGKRVLLVDDVLTTGATLSACCEVLNTSVKDIKILTLALA